MSQIPALMGGNKLSHSATFEKDVTFEGAVIGSNGLSSRFELSWVAGQRGKPGINTDILNAIEAIRMIADPDFEVQGTNMTSALCTYYAEGGITLTTAGADEDQAILVPHEDGNQSPWEQVTWGTDKEVAWEARIGTAANISDVIIWAGLKLTNDNVVATDADQVFFRYEDGVGSGVWQVISSIGGTDATTNSTVTVAVSTAYHLKIEVDSDQRARCYINDDLIYETAALTTDDHTPMIGVEAGATAAKSVVVFGQAISRVVG